MTDARIVAHIYIACAVASLVLIAGIVMFSREPHGHWHDAGHGWSVFIPD